LRAEEDADDPFATAEQREDATGTKYVAPNTATPVFTPVMLQLPSDALVKATEKIATCIQSSRVYASDKDMVLCQRLMWLAFQFDPASENVKALDKALASGTAAALPLTGKVSRPELAALLVDLAKQGRSAGANTDRKLAVCLMSLASDLDPQNKSAVEGNKIYQASGIKPNWILAEGGESASLDTGVARESGAISGLQTTALPSKGAMGATVCPGYEQRRRAFSRTQSKLTGLMVIESRDGFMIGETMDIIATVSSMSGGYQSDRVRFSRSVGEEMRVSCDEAIRAARVRYPQWDPAEITMSFGEKYSPKDGGSAGGAFTLLLLSLLDGIEYDPGFAMTGDVTVDWKIRKVGAVTEKVRAAIRDNWSLIVVPMDNARDIADMTLLYPLEVLMRGQIFGVRTVGEAVEVGRKDKSGDLAKAIEEYKKVQRYLEKNSMGVLRSSPVQDALQEVIRLAPNHLSAKYLLLAAQNRAPTRISLSNSMQELFSSVGPLWIFLCPVVPAEVSIGGESYKKARQDIMALRDKLDKDSEPLYLALSSFVATLDKMHQIEAGTGSMSLKRTQLKMFEASLNADREKVKNVLRGLQGNKEFLDRLTRN
jgi:hypothetical protein